MCCGYQLAFGPKLAAALLHTVHHAEIAFPNELNWILAKHKACLSTPSTS
jgi:hypothetical protein